MNFALLILMSENELAKIIIGSALEVHTRFGPGLLESVYKESLFYKIKHRGLNVEKEKPMPVILEKAKLECGYRIDLFIENKVIVEVKSIESLGDIHLAQILTYLRLSTCKLGLLINFNVLHLRDGIRRVVNHL